MNGSNSMAIGEFGSFGDSNFGSSSDSWKDEFSTKKKANGDFVTKRKKLRKKDKALTKASGVALGKGSVGAGANRLGAMIKAKGTEGSKGKTSHKGASDAIMDDYSYGKVGNHQFKKRKQR